MDIVKVDQNLISYWITCDWFTLWLKWPFIVDIPIGSYWTCRFPIAFCIFTRGYITMPYSSPTRIEISHDIYGCQWGICFLGTQLVTRCQQQCLSFTSNFNTCDWILWASATGMLYVWHCVQTENHGLSPWKGCAMLIAPLLKAVGSSRNFQSRNHMSVIYVAQNQPSLNQPRKASETDNSGVVSFRNVCLFPHQMKNDMANPPKSGCCSNWCNFPDFFTSVAAHAVKHCRSRERVAALHSIRSWHQPKIPLRLDGHTRRPNAQQVSHSPLTQVAWIAKVFVFGLLSLLHQCLHHSQPTTEPFSSNHSQLPNAKKSCHCPMCRSSHPFPLRHQATSVQLSSCSKMLRRVVNDVSPPRVEPRILSSPADRKKLPNANP